MFPCDKLYVVAVDKGDRRLLVNASLNLPFWVLWNKLIYS